jgi:hypothetical protein
MEKALHPKQQTTYSQSYETVFEDAYENELISRNPLLKINNLTPEKADPFNQSQLKAIKELLSSYHRPQDSLW